jgi:hypothetical protein
VQQRACTQPYSSSREPLSHKQWSTYLCLHKLLRRLRVQGLSQQEAWQERQVVLGLKMGHSWRCWCVEPFWPVNKGTLGCVGWLPWGPWRPAAACPLSPSPTSRRRARRRRPLTSKHRAAGLQLHALGQLVRMAGSPLQLRVMQWMEARRGQHPVQEGRPQVVGLQALQGVVNTSRAGVVTHPVTLSSPVAARLLAIAVHH